MNFVSPSRFSRALPPHTWVLLSFVHIRGSDSVLLLSPADAGRFAPRIALRAIIVGWTTLLTPLAIISLNQLRTPNCNYLEGLAFFGLLPMLSVVISSSIGVSWGLLIPRPKTATAVALLTIVGSLVWSVVRFYNSPAIFAYDPFFGYFPGSLYDEDVSLRAPLLWARAFHVSVAVALLALLAQFVDVHRVQLRWSARRKHTGALLILLICGAAGSALAWGGGHLGFNVATEDVVRTLGGVMRTEHFEIFYPRTLDRKEADRLAEDHEFRYAQLSSFFGAAPPKLRSFVYKTADQKRDLMGAANVYIAKPWRKEIHIQYKAFPHRVLKHELAHVFAGTYGDPIFGVSLGAYFVPNVGLIEGAATAVDWRSDGELTPHDQAALLVALNRAPPIEDLFSIRFLHHASNRAYALAGSFCRYLIERFGIAKFATLYRNGGHFVEVYGQALPDLAHAWTLHIQEIKVPKWRIELAKEHFRRPSIFRRPCAHEIANLRREAEEAVTWHEHGRATEIQRTICRYDPDNPKHELVFMRRLARSAGADAALAHRDRFLAHPMLNKPLLRRGLEMLGDYSWIKNKQANAQSYYAQALRLPAGSTGRRVVKLKNLAIQSADPLRRLLMSYLVIPLDRQRNAARDVHIAKRVAEVLQSTRGYPIELRGIGLYLLANRLISADECALALPVLRRCLQLNLPTQDFVLEALQYLGECSYKVGDWVRAASAFSRIETEAPGSGLRNTARDWLARVEWKKSRGRKIR